MASRFSFFFALLLAAAQAMETVTWPSTQEEVLVEPEASVTSTEEQPVKSEKLWGFHSDGPSGISKPRLAGILLATVAFTLLTVALLRKASRKRKTLDEADGRKKKGKKGDEESLLEKEKEKTHGPEKGARYWWLKFLHDYFLAVPDPDIDDPRNWTANKGKKYAPEVLDPQYRADDYDKEETNPNVFND